MIDRRSILAGGAMVAGATPLPVSAMLGGLAPVPAMRGTAYEPADRLREFQRMGASADDRLVLNYWRGAYLVSVPDQPLGIWLHLEGCEMRRCIPTGPASYDIQYRLMTSMVDPATGDILNGKEWFNPVTGKRNVLQPNVSSADTRLWAGEDGQIFEQFASAENPSRIVLGFDRMGPKSAMTGHKERPRTSRIKEFATMLADTAHLADPGCDYVPVTFQSTFVAPLFRFFDMAESDGQAVWHVSGVKLDRWQDVPGHHRDQIAEWHPDAYTWANGLSA